MWKEGRIKQKKKQTFKYLYEQTTNELWYFIKKHFSVFVYIGRKKIFN